MATNPFDMSAGLLGTAANSVNDASNYNMVGNINQFMNPYYENVLDSAMQRMQQNFDTSLTQLGDRAHAAGAFGGGRHGVVEGQMYGDYNRNVGELTANVMADAYNQSAGLAQNQFNNQLNAAGTAGALGGQYFNTGQAITGMQQQAGGQQQDLLNAILQGGAQQYSGYTQSPYQTIDLFRALLGSDPRQNAGQATQSSTPGLFDYLSLGLGAWGAAS